MDLLRESILCLLFPPSLKHLGTVETIKYSEAVQKAIAESADSDRFDGAGEVTAYTLYVPNHVTRDRIAA